MKSLLSGLAISTLVLTSNVTSAQMVPVDLPNQAAIDAYLRYLERPGYSAFSVSQLGTYGESWSYGLIAAAEEAAVEDCLSKEPQGYCYVVSTDGESSRDLISVEDLLARLEASKQIDWQPVAAHEVPIQIANNAEQISAYQAYTKEKGYKAFAASHYGAWGASSSQTTSDLANHLAMQACESHSQGSDNCAIIDKNNESVLGRIALAHLKQQAPESGQSQLPELAESTPRDKELARPLFGDRWDSYQEAIRNKAFAVNRLGAIGLAEDHITSLVAEEAALGACEQFQIFRLGRNNGTEEERRCYIVAVNNFYDPDIIKMLLTAE